MVQTRWSHLDYIPRTCLPHVKSGQIWSFYEVLFLSLWQRLTLPCVRRQEGHEFSSFWLDVSLPGATQVRQQAAWHWLRRDAATSACLPGHSPAVDVTDLKAALRLTIGEPLAQQLGSRQDPGKPLASGSASPASGHFRPLFICLTKRPLPPLFSL